MARDLRGLIFVAALVIIGAVFIAIPRINFSVINFEFDRGNDDAFLGLNLGLDLQGGTHLIYDIIADDGDAPSAEDVEAIRTIIERRVNAFGVSEPTVQVLGNPPNRILIQMPGQSESSLNVFVEGGDTTADDIETFFEADLGKSGVEVFVNEDASMIVTFDDFDGAESENWRTQFQEKFPTTIRATFEYEIIIPDVAADTPTDAETGLAAVTKSIDATPTSEDTVSDDETDAQQELPLPERLAPTTEQVQAAFETAGFTDLTVSDGTDTLLFLTDASGNFTQAEAIYFEAEFVGQLEGRTFDDEGNILPSDAEKLTRELADVGNFASLRTPGNVGQWTVSGGVQEAKALIGSTAQLEFRERQCGPIIPSSRDNRGRVASGWSLDDRVVAASMCIAALLHRTGN